MTQKRDSVTSYPSVWGEGSLFAYSGFDGKTDWNDPLVATLCASHIGFTVHTKREKTCWLALRSGKRAYQSIDKHSDQRFTTFEPDTVAGDLLSLRFGGGGTTATLVSLPLSRNAFLFRIHPERIPKHAILYFITRIEACKKIINQKRQCLVTTDLCRTFVTSSRIPDELAVVDSAEEVQRIISGTAELRAEYWDGDREVRYVVIGHAIKQERPVSISISTKKQTMIPGTIVPVIKDRRAFYARRIKRTGKDTAAKALSILKVNIESAQGVFKQRWTTPDRYPHRHLWLWDSCFHAPAYALIDADLGENTVTSVLDTQQPNGFIPHIGRPNGDFSNITQPPLLAWSALAVYRQTGNRAFLKNCYPKITSYLKWCGRNRDRNRNGLLQWKRSDESGMDNSSRFNRGFHFDAVDFSAIYANDLECLYHISKIVKKPDTDLKAAAENTHVTIRRQLWDRKRKFFYDRYPSGKFSVYKTACGFLPLFSGSATTEQAQHLITHLTNKQAFFTPFPVPSEAIDSPTFDNNMWRGPVWLNYNYFIIQGLKRYGFYQLAAEIRKRTLREVERWYRKEGTIFEFYDPHAKLSPRRIPRKDTYGAIKEFGWSASIYLLLKHGME